MGAPASFPMAWACADIPYEKQGFVNHILPCHVGSEDQQVSPPGCDGLQKYLCLKARPAVHSHHLILTGALKQLSQGDQHHTQHLCPGAPRPSHISC